MLTCQSFWRIAQKAADCWWQIVWDVFETLLWASGSCPLPHPSPRPRSPRPWLWYRLLRVAWANSEFLHRWIWKKNFELNWQLSEEELKMGMLMMRPVLPHRFEHFHFWMCHLLWSFEHWLSHFFVRLLCCTRSPCWVLKFGKIQNYNILKTFFWRALSHSFEN